MATKANYGDKTNMVQMAAGLFMYHLRRKSVINHLVGKMPKDIENAKTWQTSRYMPIIRAADLHKGQGDEVAFNLMNPVSAYPVMGGEYAEGRGTGMSMAEDRLRVNQARFPLDLGDTMTTLRSPVDYRKAGRPVAQDLMDRYCDQSLLVHLAGARGFHNNVEWCVPLETDPRYRNVVVNPVKAPTKNRHFVSQGDGVVSVKNNSGELDIASTSLFTMELVDTMKDVLDNMPLPPPNIIVDEDVSAKSDPLRVWLVSPSQYNHFANDPRFRRYQAEAHARASQAKNHPLFLGECGIWKGFLIKKMPYPIRFYAGDEIKYCADTTSETESVVKVPASFKDGGGFAIDRSIILGGQALAEAFGSRGTNETPFFWSEKKLDHDDKMELLIGTIRGVKKIRFNRNIGGGQHEWVDNGVIAVDTVVALNGSR